MAFEIISFLTWPLLIVVSYFLSTWAVRRFEAKYGAEHKE